MQKVISTLLSVLATTVFTVVGYFPQENTTVVSEQQIVVLSPKLVEKTVSTLAMVKVDILTTPKNLLCPVWWNLAKSVGWETPELTKLDSIMWRESRCIPSVHFTGDPNGGSYGLMQINGFWCRKSQYSKLGFLQDSGILNHCDDLYDPRIALLSALKIFNYSAEHNGNGWQPWGK